jgi:ribosome-binding ATPase YchF (GTP1/OBG family)
MTPEERIYDANRAAEVLQNESFQWALESIKQEITQSWQNSPARDDKGRELLWQHLAAAKNIEAALKSRLESGKLARLELTHKQNLWEKAKAWTS